MAHVPGLRSPYATVGRLVLFGRTLDKIRLDARGELPADYQANMGEARPTLFDARLCRFLGISYGALRDRVLQGGSDLEILGWAHSVGTPRSDEECVIWNRYMTKLGWRDERSGVLAARIAEYGLQGKPIETFFDLFDFDEGRDPVMGRAWDMRPAQVVLIMGVAGSGKTTVGLQLAQALGWAFNDADDFHPKENVAKMAAGIPLDDDDREPWLRAIRAHIDTKLASGESAVVTCSALKERYRKVVVADPSRVRLVHLSGDFALILERISKRQGHFMKETMLRSQFEALEAPDDALKLDVALPPEALVQRIRTEFSL